MQTFLLNIEESENEKIELLQELSRQLGLKIEETADREPKENPKHYFYNREQIDYSFEDIQAIVTQFPVSKRWTVYDLENEYIFPPDSPFKIQIINYEIYLMRPTLTHQEILTALTIHMGSYIMTHKLGKIYVAPVGLNISEKTILEPDILFVSVAKQHLVENDKSISKAPDLVVEVISPANYRKLREQKKQQYADFGVQEYWEIYPQKQKVKIETLQELTDEDTGETYWGYQVHSEASESGEVESTVLTGFSLEVGQLFQR